MPALQPPGSENNPKAESGGMGFAAAPAPLPRPKSTDERASQEDAIWEQFEVLMDHAGTCYKVGCSLCSRRNQVIRILNSLWG